MNFENKKILITGASGGIGKSLIRKFHDLGAIFWLREPKSKNCKL